MNILVDGAGNEIGREYEKHFHHRVSFSAGLGADYSSNNARILKFPSGEFLRVVPPEIVVGSAAGVPLGGWVDEVHCERRGQRRSALVAVDFTDPPKTDEPRFLTSAATDIWLMADMATQSEYKPVPGGGRAMFGINPDRGLVKIDDELIYYRGTGNDTLPGRGTSSCFIPWGSHQRAEEKFCPYQEPVCTCRYRMQTRTLKDCIRGVLGTEAKEHAAGARVVFIEGIPLTELTTAFPPGAESFGVRERWNFPEHEGYAVFTTVNERAWPGRGEIAGWTKSTFNKCRHFRGRYGTPEGDYREGDLIQCLPFRYWDRHAFNYEGSELAYFQGSCTARGAFWQSIEWKESGFLGGAATDRVRLRVVCRFDGEPAWDERPTNSPGGLWEFTGGGSQNFRGSRRGGIVADSIEVRAYWEYQNRAYDPPSDANDWKRNVRLDNFTVTYGSPLVVRKVDLIEH